MLSGQGGVDGRGGEGTKIKCGVARDGRAAIAHTVARSQGLALWRYWPLSACNHCITLESCITHFASVQVNCKHYEYRPSTAFGELCHLVLAESASADAEDTHQSTT
jgi:hypothetical protein